MALSAKTLQLLAEADAAIARDADYQNGAATGGKAAIWLADQMATEIKWGRIAEGDCAACRCVPSADGKVRHYGWKRRPVVKVKQM